MKGKMVVMCVFCGSRDTYDVGCMLCSGIVFVVLPVITSTTSFDGIVEQRSSIVS